MNKRCPGAELAAPSARRTRYRVIILRSPSSVGVRRVSDLACVEQYCIGGLDAEKLAE